MHDPKVKYFFFGFFLFSQSVTVETYKSFANILKKAQNVTIYRSRVDCTRFINIFSLEIYVPRMHQF